MSSKITRVVAVVNRKGGVGKSTLNILLAGALARDKRKKVCILDCDAQRSVADLLEIESGANDGEPLVPVFSLAPMFVLDWLKSFGSSYDVIFIDAPRITEDKTDTALGQLLALCDTVLIPVLGSTVDALSTRYFLRLVESMEEHKKELGVPFQYAGFINRFTSRKDNEHAADFMDKIGLPMFVEPVKDLKIFSSPSLYASILDTTEGERRFRPFLNEFYKTFKIK